MTATNPTVYQQFSEKDVGILLVKGKNMLWNLEVKFNKSSSIIDTVRLRYKMAYPNVKLCS